MLEWKVYAQKQPFSWIIDYKTWRTGWCPFFQQELLQLQSEFLLLQQLFIINW